MKKDRRHKLQTNILADRLGEAIQVVRPYFKIALSVFVVAVVVLAFSFWRHGSGKAEKAALWQEFLAISIDNNQTTSGETEGRWQAEVNRLFRMVADFEQLADKYSDESGAAWVRAAAGNTLLAAGMRQLYNDRAESRLTLMRAKGLYEDLMEEGAGDDAELYDRIRFGFGQTCEALSVVPSKIELHAHYVKQAKDIYADLTKSSSSVGIRALANYRLRILGPIAGKAWSEEDEQLDRADWSSWLAQQEFPLEFPDLFGPGRTNGSNLFPQQPLGSVSPQIDPGEGETSEPTEEPALKKNEPAAKPASTTESNTTEQPDSKTEAKPDAKEKKEGKAGSPEKTPPAKEPAEASPPATPSRK